MKQNSASLARVLPVLLLCLLCLIPPARADIGPKPEVTITVVNAPEGALYLDLLVQDAPTSSPWPKPEDQNNLDPAILKSLHSLEGDGWVLAYTTGAASHAPVFGDVRPREDGTWHYFYIGLPETFRVAAATADEARAAEVPYTRDFVSNLVYDWQTNTVRAATPAPLRFLTRLAATLVPTLIIEGAVLWLFGFREKRSWLVFLAVNAATQLGLHLVTGAVLAQAGWHFLNYFLTVILQELVIWGAEAAAYVLLLKERSRARRVGYAFAANIASFVLGYFPLHLLRSFLVHL